MVFSPDGRRLAAGKPGGGAVGRRDRSGGPRIQGDTRRHDGRQRPIGVQSRRPVGSPPAAVYGHDARVTVLDAATGQETGAMLRHNSNVKSIAFSPDGRRLASGTVDGAVMVWDTETGRESRSFKGRTSAVISLAFSPDGSRLTSVCSDWTVKAWDVTTDQETLTLQGLVGLSEAWRST